MTLILNGTDNSATTPAVTGGTGGTGTGVFYPSTNQVALATNGTTAIAVDASQNVGIGTASPSTYGKLTVWGGNAFIQSTTASVGAKITFSDTNNSAYISSAPSGVVTGLAFGIASTEAMRIDSSGNLLVGATSIPGTGIIRTSGGSGTVSFTSYSSNVAAYTSLQVVNPNGQVGSIIASGSSTAFNTSSDYRLKNNIEPMTGALAKVDALKPVTYKWKVDGSSGQGFIAHELAEVVPDCVTGEKDAVDDEGKPVYQGIDTSFLVATLTAAIQELNAKVDAQAAEIKALKAQ
jgi:hypothetical protein